jgi:hypothetical protein
MQVDLLAVGRQKPPRSLLEATNSTTQQKRKVIIQPTPIFFGGKFNYRYKMYGKHGHATPSLRGIPNRFGACNGSKLIGNKLYLVGKDERNLTAKKGYAH